MNIIRPARYDDLAGIAELHVLAARAAYSGLLSPDIISGMTTESRLSLWKNWFDLPNQQIHVLQDGHPIIGFFRTCAAEDREQPPKNFGELTHLYVDPQKMSKGLGHQLFEHAQSLMEEADFAGMLLWTIEGNERARRFYESHEMCTDGARHNQLEWLGPNVFEIRYVLRFVP